MEITVIAPEGTQTHTNITEVSLPTAMGLITIRPGHVNLTTLLVAGQIKRHDGDVLSDLESFADNSKHQYISGGIMLLENDSLRIITSDI